MKLKGGSLKRYTKLINLNQIHKNMERTQINEIINEKKKSYK